MMQEAFTLTLRAFCRRKPFRPFVLEFFSGGSLTIVHPEAVLVQAGVAFYVSPDKKVQMFDASSVVRLLDLPAE